MTMRWLLGKELISGLLMLLAFVEFSSAQANFDLAGTVFGDDSLTTLSKVSVRNKRSQDLTVSNPVGRFNIQVNNSDTLLITSIGFISVEIAVAELLGRPKTSDGRVKVYLKTSIYMLKPVSLTVKRPPKLDHEYYQKIFTRPKPTISSPISALYERFSKRGKELRKLEVDYYLFEYYRLEMNRFRIALYPEIQSEEEIMKVIMHCKIPQSFVVNAIDYDFNLRVMECLKSYKGK